MEQSTHAVALHRRMRDNQPFSKWKKKALSWRGSDCSPHDDSQATEEGTELFPAWEVFRTHKDKALSNPVWSSKWPGFQQEVGLETSQAPFWPELSNEAIWKHPAAHSILFPKLLFYSKWQGTYSIHSSYVLPSFSSPTFPGHHSQVFYLSTTALPANINLFLPRLTITADYIHSLEVPYFDASSTTLNSVPTAHRSNIHHNKQSPTNWKN